MGPARALDVASIDVASIDVTSSDGRRARSERSRDAAVDAILDLLNEGAADPPSAAEVAERSGLSIRTVFRLFDDLESLYAAAVEHQRQRLGEHFVFEATRGDVDQRIADLIAQRVRLYEVVLHVRPFAEQLRHTSEAVGAVLKLMDTQQREQLAAQFAPELAPRSAAERTELLDALAVATGWGAWDVLRRQQHRSRTRAGRAMARMVSALLGD